jgi:hypothetical protein
VLVLLFSIVIIELLYEIYERSRRHSVMNSWSTVDMTYSLFALLFLSFCICV